MERYTCSKCKNWFFVDQLYKGDTCPMCGTMVIEPIDLLPMDEIVAVMVTIRSNTDGKPTTFIIDNTTKREMIRFRKAHHQHVVEITTLVKA